MILLLIIKDELATLYTIINILHLNNQINT